MRRLVPRPARRPVPSHRRYALIRCPASHLILIPVIVWIKVGLCSADSLINILLCCLGYLPGLIHAWYIIARYPEHNHDQYAPVDGGERGDRVYDVSHQQANNRHYGTQSAQPQAPKKPAQQPQRSVGAPEGSGSSEAAAPPSYSSVVAGDHKVQTRD